MWIVIVLFILLMVGLPIIAMFFPEDVKRLISKHPWIAWPFATAVIFCAIPAAVIASLAFCLIDHLIGGDK